MADIVYDCELKHTFNNNKYYVRALHKENTLYVEVEQEANGHKWKNQFVNSYIEEMTNKTGNFKTFDKFCKMMYAALQSNNGGTVFIDLLTYQDLEILKARKAVKNGIKTSSSLNATQRTKNKRYLILTYVVEYDRVHYPLALKLDEHSITSEDDDDESIAESSIKANNNNNLHNHCAIETAQKLLSYSSQNGNNMNTTSHSNSSFESISSINSSPVKYYKRNKTKNKNKNCRNHLDTNNISNKNQKRNNYPSSKLTDIIEVLEDEVKILKSELEKKNLEILRINKSTSAYKQKHISSRLDDLEDEIERLSTELLSERTKCRRINRDFYKEKLELNKQIEMLKESNIHYKNKCKVLKDQLNETKNVLNNVRKKASKKRLYSSTSSTSSYSDLNLRRSRSRSNKNKNKNKNKSKNKYDPNRKYLRNNNNISQKLRYQRSSSAPRFNKSNNYRNIYTRSRSPIHTRFDPTAWAKNKKKQIDQAKANRNTFGKSKSPSPFRNNSRSVSPNRNRNRSRNILRDRSNSRNRNKKRNNKKNIRKRSNSRKRNSFGTTISRSPKLRKKNKISKPPLHPSKYLNKNKNENKNKENYNDLNILSGLEKRKQTILQSNNSFNKYDEDDDDDDDESTFNPTKEIESIDSRLNALQKFLRAAKSSS